jgi:F420-dependent oxidoreductase-like protein
MPRHPIALAQQALTVQQSCGGRLLLGIGASHAAVIEKRMGIDHSRPFTHMRETLDVLPDLLAGRRVDYRGELISASAQLTIEGTSPPPIVLAALGPRMLELAGERADGVAIWLGGPRFLEEFALPRIQAGASRADRAVPPRVFSGLPVVVTSDADGAREAAQRFLGLSSKLPAYRAVLEREGVETPSEVAIVGDEEKVARELEHIAALGIPDFHAVTFPVESDPDALRRTHRFLAGFGTPAG